ncbi:MAG: 30S ribosomal protein S15 [Candidatus Sungbacteria bacterium RIFCSPLOWO2_02_FULL_54_10]|uniref:Small ribosomal subunit protein uS15 n=2 Tax=Candidatus Sungiibacteriota TaxID=1817917 RepID=A0A1G2L7U7_9BACT|nr:MAG: 30S ribosomal protein S15 [Candidatus Sungbacteria bacterium RIFCSPHIGHO2_02_FULL_53_17]OHA06819.1 MAG: 30S ribosomal protein S15 [Candidatus Sungbacteria bacterium RIFCSPLOWO2_01_FULL_54_21]OHA13079.1 MAG: 30S ribosomal protein S15 [Candidatus Sungbacteria bacterium RIFCSPLOWO2_02_FULL_54_10]
MALTAKEKQKVIANIRTHEKDTGSSAVQIAILSAEIIRLTDHLKVHRKDNHSRRGLLTMVAQRKKLLGYLKDQNARQYGSIIKKLGLKRS